MLDEARHIAGIPFFKLNSTLRSPEQNKAVGGKPNSTHLRGLADIHAPTSAHKYKIVNSAIQVGFKELDLAQTLFTLTVTTLYRKKLSGNTNCG